MIVVKVGGSLFDHPALGVGLRSFIESLAPKEVLLVPGGGPLADAVRQLDRTHKLGEEASHWLALRALGVTATFLERILVSSKQPELSESVLIPSVVVPPGLSRPVLAPLGPQSIAQGVSPGKAAQNTTSPEGAAHAVESVAPSRLCVSTHSPTQGLRPELLTCAPSGRREDSKSLSGRREDLEADSERRQGALAFGSRLAVLDCFAFALEDESRPAALPHSWSVTTDSIAARVAVVLRAERLILLKSTDIPPRISWEEAANCGWVDAHFPQVVTTLACPVEVVNFRVQLDARA